MKTLDLVLKGKWYDMIASGKKKEEYRDIKPYWQRRFMNCHQYVLGCDHNNCCKSGFIGKYEGKNCFDVNIKNVNNYDNIRFRRGYTNQSMLFKFKEQVSIGIGKPEWGAPENKVFILKIGERIE